MGRTVLHLVRRIELEVGTLRASTCELLEDKARHRSRRGVLSDAEVEELTEAHFKLPMEHFCYVGRVGHRAGDVGAFEPVDVQIVNFPFALKLAAEFLNLAVNVPFVLQNEPPVNNSTSECPLDKARQPIPRTYDNRRVSTQKNIGAAPDPYLCRGQGIQYPTKLREDHASSCRRPENET